ncbi:phospholipid-transporting ATPase ABCA1 isoform X1 [Tribolium castaneum]|uniref:phospholipid-transporting ATPase ABCA1 isoform X1 n=1 Tax=Tribolium castaneum TaxID=7070 RepID=UPI0030FEA86F
MIKALSKIWILVCKDITLWTRQITLVIYEVVFPILFCFLIIMLRRNTGFITDYESQTYEAFSPKPGTLCSGYDNETEISVAFSPTSPLLKDILKNVCPNVRDIKAYQTSNKLNEAVKNKKFAFALQMDDKLSGARNINDLPDVINISLRLPSEDHKSHQKAEWYTNLLYPLLLIGSRDFDDKYAGPPSYENRGFLYLQKHVILGFLNKTANATPNLDIEMKRFPYPEWTQNTLNTKQTQLFSAMMMVLMFMTNVNNAVTEVATEKEAQLKEYMKIMGLSAWLHWLSWFLRYVLVLVVVIIAAIVIFKVQIALRPVFIYTDGTVLFVLFLIFGCSLITYSFLMSTIFPKAILATIVATVIYTAAVLAAFSLVNKNDILPQNTKIAMSFFSPMAMFFALVIVFQFEATGEGSQWSNMSESTLVGDLPLGTILLIMVLDTIIYMIITIYLEAVLPSEFGVAKPWYFLFTPNFWCTKPQEQREQPTQAKGDQFEEFTENLPVGIRIKNLSKTFGHNTVVKNLDLEMYEGHITVLLGHNGAGKTTTMSMICGIIPPTSGTAVVNGHDVRTNAQKVRESMGLCLQHNVLFDNLSVEEHVVLFCKLKGMNDGKKIKDEVNSYLKILEIEDKRKTYSKRLSGGMKRKLSVAIAFCGQSKVVILDEPTAGMDPSARRTVWELLQKQKKGRTILLTTHYMDEADLLGDRIAIMTVGELQCCGSSFFLKKKYGSGYSLILEITPKCHPEYVTDMLRKHIPYLKIHARMGSELTYILPDKDSRKFEALLFDLERQKSSLGVLNFGIQQASLEEIFLKVGAEHDKEIAEMFNKNQSQGSVSTKEEPINLTGCSLLRNQIMAMLLKKKLSLFRSWILFLFQIILPLIIVAGYTLMSISEGNESSYPSLKITLSSYNNTVTLLEKNGADDLLPDTYVKALKDHTVKTVDNITKEILDVAKNLTAVKNHYIVAASFNDTAATAWFNGDPYHAVPLSLSLVLSTMYKARLGEKKSVTFFNHPLPPSNDAQLVASEKNKMSSAAEMGVMLGVGIAVCTYVMFYIRERVCKCKHLQMISGVNVFVFWSTAFFCDLLACLSTTIFLLILLIESPLSSLQTAEIGLVVLLFVGYFCFVLPFIYLISYCFKVPAMGCTILVSLCMYMAIIPYMAMMMAKAYGASKSTLSTMYRTFVIVPFYTIGRGISDVTYISSVRKLCLKNNETIEQACARSTICCETDYYSLEAPGIGLIVAVSFIMCLVLFTIIFLIEFGFFSCLFGKIVHFTKRPNKTVILESDVQDENTKIKNSPENELKNNYSVILRDLTKYYGANFLAVNGLCLGIKPYECFGLLGVNGAGKTTTFQMMTGDSRITYGNAWVHGWSIKTHPKQVQKFVGYCPQFDALLDDLTVRETLLMFGLIRGIPLSQCLGLAEGLARDFDFLKHVNKKVKQLSGGNKRKLSTALALIGDPPVIFLDEPSAGMDPATKRFLWNGLARLRDSGKCIILTSHSMEECEALCTRIAIMVNGTFQCLGSTQRLKSKFAQGFSLSIKIKRYDDKAPIDEQVKNIDNFVQKYFPGSELKERYQELVTYHLVNEKMSLSQMFGLIEGSRRQLSIEDYSLGQCSLEQVFLSFAKEQKEQ